MRLPFSTPLSFLGVLTTYYLLHKAYSFVQLYFLHRSTLRRYLRTSKTSHDSADAAKEGELDIQPSSSSWAIVTGASDGIGLGFAQELCSRGFNVILHGRNPTKLSKLQGSLHESFPSVQTRTLVLDAASFTHSTLTTALEPLLSLPIKVIVNNVGGTAGILKRSDFTPFGEHTATEINDLVSVNASFPTHFTNALLPTLVKNQPSLVMNIGSTAYIGMPYVSIYSATKAYNIALSNAMAGEWRGEGYDIESLGIVVGSVKSAGNAGAKLGWAVPTCRKMASAALDRVGCGRAVVAGFWAHGLQVGFLKMMPERMVSKMLMDKLKPMRMRKATDAW